jgi:hypothetical protein
MSMHYHLYNYAVRLGLLDNPTVQVEVAPMVVHANGSWKILPATTHTMPIAVDRSSDDTPNLAYDQFTRVHALPGKQGSNRQVFTTFWESQIKLLETLNLLKESKILRAFTKKVQRFSDSKNLETVLKDAIKIAGIKNTSLWVAIAMPDGTLLYDLPGVQKWWKNVYQQEILADVPTGENWYQVLHASSKQLVPTGVCLITGHKCIPARLHPRVTGVPGGGGMKAGRPCDGDVPLSSWSKPAFAYTPVTKVLSQDGTTIYLREGRKEGWNFPICMRVAAGYTTALSYLLRKIEGRYDRRGGAILTADDEATLMWSSAAVGDSLVDAIINVCSGPKKEIAAPIWEIISNSNPPICDVHILSVRGSQGRMAVMGWYTISMTKLCECILQFKTSVMNSDMSLRTFVRYMTGHRVKDRIELPVDVYRDLLHSIVSGTSIFSRVIGACERRAGDINADGISVKPNDELVKLAEQIGYRVRAISEMEQFGV